MKNQSAFLGPGAYLSQVLCCLLLWPVQWPSPIPGNQSMVLRFERPDGTVHSVDVAEWTDPVMSGDVQVGTKCCLCQGVAFRGAQMMSSWTPCRARILFLLIAVTRSQSSPRGRSPFSVAPAGFTWANSRPIGARSRMGTKPTSPKGRYSVCRFRPISPMSLLWECSRFQKYPPVSRGEGVG